MILGVGDGFGSLHSETFKANTSRQVVIDNDVAFLFFTEGPLENGSYRGRLLELNNPTFDDVWYRFWTWGARYPTGIQTNNGWTQFITGVSPTDSQQIPMDR